VENFRRLMPRLYSISSSPAKYPEEIHLTVAVVRYETNGRTREGVCSTYLADRARLNQPDLPVFVANSHFGLPADDNIPVIMVGPGTGVAPFRSFVMDRATRGAKGPNWLFFGDQRRSADFLYESEWNEWQKSGVLTRLDLAFSRDQEQKIYVQDRMRENGAELWKWISAGAYFYVCGDAKRMAKDVDAALHEIIAQHGGMTPEAAIEFVKQLKKAERYQRDVY
jgi:sulfite reductase (NADPH) flavoprotein alpha-component